MTAEQLRNSILQEAISGRLVPQDPNDEPAAVLLQRIREEKARLVKESKLKKKDLVETPITEEEIPFEIPASWEWVRYKDIADCALGKTKNPNQVSGDLCPYLCSINVDWDRIRLEVLKEMLFSDTDKQKYSVKKGDLLICEGGEAGRAAIYDGEVSPLYYQNALHRVRFYGKLCARFYLFQMELYKKTGLLNEHIKGETIQHFVSTKLLNLPIPIPPLAEQKRIVAKLEELLPIVEQYGKAQKELDELNAALPARLRQSILQEAISGRLVPQDSNDEPASALLARIREEKARLVKEGKLKKKDLVETPITDDEKPFEIPSSWAWLRISDLCYITNGFTPLRTEPRFWTNGSISWFTVEDIRKQGEIINYTTQKITPAATSQERIVRAGSTLLCCTASVGQCAITNIPLTTNQQFNALTVKEWFMPIVDDKYLYWFAKTLAPTLHSLAGQTTFEFVSVKKVGSILIPLPPLAEQQRIVAKIEELFEQIDKISK